MHSLMRVRSATYLKGAMCGCSDPCAEKGWEPSGRLSRGGTQRR